MSDLSHPFGVIFDMGDILYDATGWRRWLAERLQQEGIDIDYPRLVVGWEAALVSVYLGERPYWDAFTKFLTELGVDQAKLESLQQEAKIQGKELSAVHTPFPGVDEQLKRMKNHGLKLAVLSDNESPASKVRTKLQRFSIDQYFDEVITSYDIGAVKPMPEAFEAATEALGITKDQAAFVAHDLDELEGSVGYGLFTVAFNFEGEVPADFHTQSFSEVADVVIERSERCEGR